MSDLEKAEHIAERLRQEPYHLLLNDCIIKSVRLKRECAELGIKAKVTVCIGLAQARFFGRWLTIPVIHAWAEVESKRLETSRPLGSSGIWGIVPVDIRPVLAVRF
jgi:hypothetical protein